MANPMQWWHVLPTEFATADRLSRWELLPGERDIAGSMFDRVLSCQDDVANAVPVGNVHRRRVQPHECDDVVPALPGRSVSGSTDEYVLLDMYGWVPVHIGSGVVHASVRVIGWGAPVCTRALLPSWNDK